MVVRVIEYVLDGIPDPEFPCRLIFNRFGIDAVSGVELAAFYHHGWTIEQTLDELKVIWPTTT